MGGKKKGTGAQPRTKDNLKPSSSEKAAQFLIQQTGRLGLPSTLSTTDLFGTVPLQYGEQTESIVPTKVPGLVPVPQDPDASALEPRLLSTLKRLEKRDSVTKQKALKELIELLGSTVSGDVSSLDTSSVIVILPFWPRIYCRLAVDENRKVRELIQSAMGRVADRVGRELGPYIKQVFPIWAFSTVDVHEPAASLASQGIRDTFPGLKRLDAYRVCARQILDLIETKVSEEFGSSSVVSQTPVTTKKTKGSKEKRTTESTSPDVLADLDVDDHCTLQMAACIRFIASIVEDFSNLPVDSPHLVRLRKYLSPVNLWTVVSRHICQHVSRHTTADGRCRVGYSPAVHSTIYRLATALCTQPSWAAWLAESEEGRELAAYLCTSTIAQLGPVDRKVKLLTNDTPCPIPAPLTVVVPGFSCYAQAWEASLACLTYLPASLIWSVIDWRVDVCLPLKQLLQDVAMGYSKQVYPNLVCLLSRLPLDYQNLSLEDSQLLEDLFVGAALKGLERVLTPRSGIVDSVSVSVLGSTVKTNPIVSIDPSLSTTIVTGLLVCCRFLIDRLTTESESKNIPGPLCLRLVNQVVLRLFADALHVVRPDNLEHTYLVCTQPPLARQDFLQAVFCQMSSLFANLARAPEPSAKFTLFFHIRDELLRWVSEIPKSVISDSSSSSDHPEGLSMHTHLGLLDSLRLTQFVNCLAHVVSNYNSSNASVGKSGRITSLQQQNVSRNGSTAKITATQDTWFINLLVEICKQIEAQSSSTSLDPLIETSFCVSYLSLSSYLPEDVPIQLLNAEQKLFFQILPTLSDDLLPLFLTDSTVRGLVRSWSLSTDYSKPLICRPSALSRHRFLTAVLPTLIRVLPPDTNLCPRVCDLCLNWTDEWIQNVLTDSTDSDPLPLTDLAALLSLVYSTAATQNHSIVVNLRNSLLSAVLCHLSRQLPPSDLPDLSELPAPLLRNMATLCFMTLKEICPTGKMLEHEKEIVAQVKELLVLLLRLVLVLYVVHHFACVASVVDPSCELAAMLVSVSSTAVHPSDTTDGSPAIHSLYGLSLSTLLSQIEQLFISSSSLINSLSPEDSIPLILHTVIHTAYVPMQMIQFIELFVRQSAIHSVSDTNLVLTGLWLSTITDAMVAVIDAVVECEPFTWHNSCPPPRPILFPAGLIPLTVLPPLGRLFRVWQLGSRLQITSSSLGSIDSDQWIRYTYCLGVLRGCLASLAEPFDPCVTFGWPSPFNSQETPKDTHGQQYIDSFTDGHLEPAWSAFGQWESTIAAQLGLCWHNATSESPLSTFIDLLSLSTVYRHFPQLTDIQISVLCSIFSSVCLNRIRSVHPNYWPRDFQLTASCTDDPLRPEFSWLDDHIRTRSDRTHDVAHFSRICELEMPAGIVQRCLPRQELLGRLKCLTMIDTAVDKATKDIFEEPPEAHRVLQLLASLISVHSVSPLYATTFLSVITVDYQKWLTQLADSTDADGLVSSTGNDSGLRATLGAMGFIESLLLLWQPWQWYMDTVGKSAIMHNLGLIQLSMRLKQLRPVLTRNEWDLILCLIISWVCLVIEQTDNHKRQQGENRVDVLATRAFRAAAALGAVFIERIPDPVSFDALIISSAQTLKGTPSKSAPDTWEDGLDGEVIDNEDDTIMSDQDPQIDDNFEEDKITKDLTCDSSKVAEDGLFSELEDDPDSFLAEEELPILSADDDANFDTETLSWNSIRNLLPHKCRPPTHIREDWNKFFSNHLYSTLLPSVLDTCLSIDPNGTPARNDTSRSSQSLCAAFATCPMSELVRLLTAQPHLILEYLVDLNRASVHGVQLRVKQIIPKRADSLEEMTTGLRACLDFGSKLICCSPIQSGQLLGHAILSRILCSRTRRTGTKNTLYLSNYLLHRLPTPWLLGLYGSLPVRLESDLVSERALTDWGRGSSVLTYLVRNSVRDGWFLDTEAHHQLLSYLLSWDCLLTMLTSAGPQARARLQRALLGPSAALFDRFLLCLGLLLPPPGNLETMIVNPCRLEPDERLLLPVSASRSDLIAAMSLRTSTHQRIRRPMRLAIPVASGDDREWRDPFNPDDRLLYLPGNRLASDISHLAVRLLRRFLAEAPALMRGWITRLSVPAGIPEDTNTNTTPVLTVKPDSGELLSPLCGQRCGRLRQLASVADKLVSRHFSPGLARDEVLLVQYKAQLRELKRGEDGGQSGKSKWFGMLTGGPTEIGTITIRGRPLSREVIATYQVTDEHSMEMLIQLPDNYPLGLVTVSCGRGVGISQQQWHMWTVQLSVFINNQNGSILDGIDLWQKNVRKKFEGVEECAICYSVVHNSNFSLPKMQCHTCHKLFHYACMYRWFTTSRNPVCPLCRHRFFGPTGRPIT